MNSSYLIGKVVNHFQIHGLRRNCLFGNFFCLNKKPDNPKEVIFYFPNYQFMHLGDHLFFEPLIRYLKESGLNVSVKPIKSMEFYFKKNGYKIAKDSDLNKADLVISKVELISELTFFADKSVILIETAYNNISTPLCNDMIEKLSKILNLELKNFDAQPKFLVDLESDLDINFVNGEKYMLFNNYIDSGFFRVREKHQIILMEFAKKIKKDFGFKIIHTGSNEDLKKDKRNYPFVDIDIRGKSSIESIFYLANLDSVKGNISFDAFQMHLFFMVRKKSYILFRGRFLKKNEKFIKEFVNPPFKIDIDHCDLIEYL